MPRPLGAVVGDRLVALGELRAVEQKQHAGAAAQRGPAPPDEATRRRPSVFSKRSSIPSRAADG